ncbi:Mitochondrial genome maintenance protein mgm101 [Golovinomyces cichoracearum]|uniref:Mitochondrial genome maintenance protein MGM101 n=1 Tax=Golovinomyces cichoracearum TaxID=62708 RepID=A0A420IDM0_9PEZI|nr:Mitochondrial genome maintenance protein mgm101 [Golovinomyces cichoracearum]
MVSPRCLTIGTIARDVPKVTKTLISQSTLCTVGGLAKRRYQFITESTRLFSNSPQLSVYVKNSAPADKPAYSSSKSLTSSPVGTLQSTNNVEEKNAIKDISGGLSDEPFNLGEASNTDQVDWTRSFHGLSSQPFSKEAADVLMAPLEPHDIEVKPDGIIYLPEIKYRRILNKSFGPGGWGLAPRGETIVTGKSITREYALLAHGRLVSVARGEQDYFSPEGIPTATEGCKSNALMRCCKDLGVASELWDPRFIRKFMKENAKQVWAEHVVTKKKKQVWIRKDDEVRYPYKQT